MSGNLLKYSAFIFLTLLSALIPTSCNEDIPELSNASRIKADSVFRVQEKILKAEIDSLCGLAYQEIFEDAVDSISGVRIKEIEAISNR